MTTTGFAAYTITGNMLNISVELPKETMSESALYPYLSQWDIPPRQIEYAGQTFPAIANRTRGDCGPASLGSIIWKWTQHRPTVNEIGIACGQPASGAGSMYTGYGQLRAGAKAYGLTLETRSPYVKPRLDMDLVRAELGAGRPVIALIHYGALREVLSASYPNAIQNQDKFSGTHFVALVEMDELNVFAMDPDFWKGRRQDGSYRPIPIDALDEAMRRVPESPWATVPYQGLVLVNL
jgi:hypothetical protein